VLWVDHQQRGRVGTKGVYGLKAGEFFKSQGCATWTKSGEPGSPGPDDLDMYFAPAGNNEGGR
jgi:hypothetical protein